MTEGQDVRPFAEPAGPPTALSVGGPGAGSVIVERHGDVLMVRDPQRPPDAEPARDQPIAVLGTVAIPGVPGPVGVILVERAERRVLVRQLDPGEPLSEGVPVFDGDEVSVMGALSHVGVHTDEDGAEGFLFAMRIVPVREEPGEVFVRTLRHGEPDDGRRVHYRPGDTVTIEPGSMTAELDHIDSLEPATASGYVRLTPALWTWLSLGEHHDANRTRYLLAAARRLDAANQLFMTVEDRRRQLTQDGLAGPDLRRLLFELLAAVEMAVVALGRAVDMVRRAVDLINSTAPVPAQIETSWTALNAIRNAYEHIEDRALGQTRGVPHPDALTIFNQTRLLNDRLLVYGGLQLDVATEVPALLAAARQFIKAAAADG